MYLRLGYPVLGAVIHFLAASNFLILWQTSQYAVRLTFTKKLWVWVLFVRCQSDVCLFRSQATLRWLWSDVFFFFQCFVQPNQSHISLTIPLLEVPVSNLGPKSCYPDIFSSLLLWPEAKRWAVRQIRPRPLPFTSLPFHYSAPSHHFTRYNLVYWQLW